MTVDDGHRLPDALDDLANRSLTPKVLLADSHYGSADNMTLTDERTIGLKAPAPTARGGSSGRLTREERTLDQAGLVLHCPHEIEPVSTCAARTKLQARFDLAIAQNAQSRHFARCRLISMTGSSRAFNTRRSARKTKDDGSMKAAKSSATSTDGAQGWKRRCHG